VNIAPGWSDGDVIRIENRAHESVYIRVYAEDWEYEGIDGAKKFFPPGGSRFSGAEWIKFFPSSFTLPAQSSQEVNYVVSVPADAQGGRYSVLFFEVKAGKQKDQESGAFVDVFYRLGSLFYIEPEGAVNRSARIEDLVVEADTLAKTMEVRTTIVNTGNANIGAVNTFDVIDENGFVFTRGKSDDIYLLPDDKGVAKGEAVFADLRPGTYDLILTTDLATGEVFVTEASIEIGPSGVEKVTVLE